MARRRYLAARLHPGEIRRSATQRRDREYQAGGGLRAALSRRVVSRPPDCLRHHRTPRAIARWRGLRRDGDSPRSIADRDTGAGTQSSAANDTRARGGVCAAVEGYQQRMASALARVARGVTLTYANEATLAEALATIRRLPADSLIFYARCSPITRSRVMLPDEVFAQIADASPVPIYSSNDTNLGMGAVGGMMRSEIEMGARLGAITLRSSKGRGRRTFPSKVRDWRRCSTGGRCSAGGWIRPCCRLAQSCVFVTRRCGSSTGPTSLQRSSS